MASPKSSRQNLQPHPLLGRLLAQSGVEARAFRGYIGPSTADGRVRLYPSLGDLSFSIEIAEADILESKPAPETLLPHGGTIVWVRQDAEVVFHGKQVTTVSVRALRHAGRAVAAATNLGAAPAGAGRFVEVQRGRVSIRLRSRVMDTCASCSCSSCETHPSCTSNCKSDLSLGSVVVSGP